MNTADSQLLASELERMGYSAASDPDQADILVVNTCVVRQQAEDKALGRLALLNELKKEQPDKVIGVMGCLVGVRDPLALRKRLPYVDVFMPPSEPKAMVDFLRSRMNEAEILDLEARERDQRDLIQDGDLILPRARAGQPDQRARAGRLRLLARLHLLHHPVPARHRAQPQRRRNRRPRPQSGAAGRQGSHAARSDRGSLRQRHPRRARSGGFARASSIRPPKKPGWSASAS